jgi:hypothetical protein
MVTAKYMLQVLNMKVKGKCPSGGLRSRWEQQVRKDVTQKEECGKKLMRRSYGKTDIDNPHEVKMSWGEENTKKYFKVINLLSK